MANLQLSNATDRQVALMAAAIVWAEKGGSYMDNDSIIDTARKFLSFLEDR